MAVNKVEANGETLIDLTNDTVTADTLVEGRTAHLASGEQVTGTFTPVTGVKGNAESAYRVGNVNLTPANIGLGNVNNTSDANKPISTATQAALNGKVNKSGDTMTGTLTHQATSSFFKATNLDLNGDNPSAYTWGNSRIEFVDKDGSRSGFINAGRASTGYTQWSMAATARNTADTQDVYNQFDLSVYRDGTCTYKVTDPAAFRTAISAASKDQVNYNTNNGVKNLLYTKPVTRTVNGVTISCTSPNKYSISGTPSNKSTELLIANLSTGSTDTNTQYPASGEYAPGDYIVSVSGIPAGINVQIIAATSVPISDSPSNYRVLVVNSGNTTQRFTLAENEKYLWFRIGYNVTSATTYNNDEFEIMLRSATIEDSTFEPYAKSNAELTQEMDNKADASSASADGITLQNSYANAISKVELKPGSTSLTYGSSGGTGKVAVTNNQIETAVITSGGTGKVNITNSQIEFTIANPGGSTTWTFDSDGIYKNGTKVL